MHMQDAEYAEYRTNPNSHLYTQHALSISETFGLMENKQRIIYMYTLLNCLSTSSTCIQHVTQYHT